MGGSFHKSAWLILALALAACSRDMDTAKITAPDSEMGAAPAFALTGSTVLEAEILSLVQSGVFTIGQGNALLVKPRNADRQAIADRIAPALAQIDTVIAQVGDFVSDGVLTPAQGQTLIALAQAVRQALASGTAAVAYISNTGDGAVFVVDQSTASVVGTIPVGDQPVGVAFSPDGTSAYVANFGSGVSVIETATHSVVATITLGGFPEDVAVSRDGSRVYVSNATANTVTVIETASNGVVATIPVGAAPGALAVTPDGAFVYVSARNGGAVQVIATSTNTIVGSIAFPFNPGDLAMSPDGSTVYVLSGPFRSELAVVETSSNTVTRTITLAISGESLLAVGVSPDGSVVYVTRQANNAPGGEVLLVDAGTGAVLGSAQLGYGPQDVAVADVTRTP
jgi:YVTN family beta-propeller protein